MAQTLELPQIAGGGAGVPTTTSTRAGMLNQVLDLFSSVPVDIGVGKGARGHILRRVDGGGQGCPPCDCKQGRDSTFGSPNNPKAATLGQPNLPQRPFKAASANDPCAHALDQLAAQGIDPHALRQAMSGRPGPCGTRSQGCTAEDIARGLCPGGQAPGHQRRTRKAAGGRKRKAAAGGRKRKAAPRRKSTSDAAYMRHARALGYFGGMAQKSAKYGDLASAVGGDMSLPFDPFTGLPNRAPRKRRATSGRKRRTTPHKRKRRPMSAATKAMLRARRG